MMRKIILGILLLLIMIPSSQAATVSDCTDITASGYYEMTGDITGRTDDHCMNITASDVIFDCNYHNLDGDTIADYGIRIQNLTSSRLDNITVRNCYLTDWDYSMIYFRYADNSTIENITTASSEDDTTVYVNNGYNITMRNVTSNVKLNDGITLYQSTYCTISDSTAIHNLNALSIEGIRLQESHYNTVENSVVQNFYGRAGIYLTDSNNNIIRDINVTGDVSSGLQGNNNGIELDNSNTTSLYRITVDGTDLDTNYGIYVKDSVVLVAENITTTDWIFGIYINATNNITLINMTSNSNTYHGLVTDTVSNGIIRDSNISINNYYNFYMIAGSNISIEDSTSYGGSDSTRGIFSTATNSSISGTTTYGMTGSGIYITGDDNTVDSCISYSNGDGGVVIFGSTNIVNNTITYNNTYGIQTDHENNTIENLTSYENSRGVFLEDGGTPDARRTNLSNSNIYNNSIGIYIDSDVFGCNIYNNFLNNTKNVEGDWGELQFFNMTKISGTNIIGGSNIGGNAWVYPNGTGFSQNCNDSDVDGICDNTYAVDSESNDYLPLAYDDDDPPSWSDNQTNIVSNYSSTNKSQFNVTWTDNSGVRTGINTVLIEGNWSGSAQNYSMTHLGSGVYNFSVILPAGTFYWISCANDSAGNLNCSDKWTFTINKASTTTTNLINGSDSDVSKSVGSTINFTGISSASGLNVTIYINGTLSGNNITITENISDTTGWTLGDYNISMYTLENENYTGSSSMHTLTLFSADAPSYSNIKPQAAQTYAWDSEFQLNITWEWNASNPIDTVFLEYGGSNITITSNRSISGTSAEFYYSLYNLSAGNYNYIWWANNSLGNWAKTPTQTLTVSKANPEASMLLVASPSWNVYSDQSIIIQGSELNNGDDDLEYNLTRNGVNVTNPYSATESVGTYTFAYTVASGENYTAGTLQETLSVTSRPTTAAPTGGAPPGKEELTIPDSITFIIAEGECQQINATFTWSDVSSKYIFFNIPENATEYLVKPRSGDRIKVDEGQNQIEFLACLPEDLPQILPQCMEEIDMSIIDVDMLFQKYDTWLNQTVEQLKRGIKFNINVSWDDETQELPIFIYLKEKKEEEFIPPPGIEIYLIAGIIIIIIIVSVYFLVPTKEGGR